jgi:hypothetical protein
MVIKLDMGNAFDGVRHGFLFTILKKKMGLGSISLHGSVIALDINVFVH